MNKSKFLELVKNPESIAENDLTKLEALAIEHPYSQVLHVLNVKAQKSHSKPDFEKALNLAATYVYDRNLLHSLIEGKNVTAAVSPIPEIATDDLGDVQEEEVSDFNWINEVQDHEVDPAQVDEPSIAEPSINTGEPDIVSDKEQEPPSVDSPETPEKTSKPKSTEVDRESEQAEEASTTGQEETTDKAPENAQAEEVIENTVTDTTETVTAELKEISESLEELADQESAEEKASDEKDTTDAVEKNPEESLNLDIQAGSIHAELMENLNQLQENKQQYENPTEEIKDPQHRQEQIEIIDNFIKNSPVLSKPNLSADSEAETQDDLSKKSTKLNEEMVSENLAKIYLKQGKRKDAEKIYKKLIRKFPQKKGYFADQIEKIKKKK